MCEIYLKADPIQYELRTRSIRIHGVVTSVRLENLCWDILARIARKDDMTTNQLISQLYSEVIQQQGKIGNFCAFLRVSCMRYLSSVALQQDKESLLLGRRDVVDPPLEDQPKAGRKVRQPDAVVLQMIR
ncbi:ribbon-helix-helix domain-containing protein [Glaciimonas sp. Gout2]|uniref:ribbon-helix-helix domain-containing protein n=1 Tax=unclassified Glaciimonas TaxID=2644401 RepID=UPI002B23E831|nr:MULTISPECIES: ribbon-helix-helix domain-containing protein [unclassified Glaciimonas]MEB0014440.1 ribbon-helix-helix domain-containing protein [Glaciimonas sp. Cout2]MEB0084640.1 ribbon-helix-helix domain-containing protein [Glaciimonas sp. Gout2]